MSQKLFEIKEKEKEDQISREFIRKIISKDERKKEIEPPVVSSQKETSKSLIEDLNSKSTSEKEALESLMNLGARPSESQPSSNPVPPPPPVLDIPSTVEHVRD